MIMNYRIIVQKIVQMMVQMMVQLIVEMMGIVHNYVKLIGLIELMSFQIKM